MSSAGGSQRTDSSLVDVLAMEVNGAPRQMVRSEQASMEWSSRLMGNG